VADIDLRYINLYLALAYVLLLPFSVLLSLVIGLWVLWQLVNYRNVRLQGLFKNVWVLFSFAFFLAHVIAAFFSQNGQEALTSIEIKLSFLFLPILVYISGFDVRALKKIVSFFVLSVTISLLVCLARMVYVHFTTDKGWITYSEFSLFLHPSYFAMYIVFSLLILFGAPLRLSSNSLLHWFMVMLVSAIHVTGLFCCASKMGLLAFGALIPVLILVVLLRNRHYLVSAIFVAAAILGLFLVLRSDMSAAARLRNAFTVAGSAQNIDIKTTESNAVRILIWGEASDLIARKPVLGYTPGDANDRLYEAYKQKGMEGALEHHLNAHNQYLQTTIGLGFLGGILLVVLTLGPVVFGIFRKNGLAVLFGLLIILNFAVESMLQTQAGTLFFVFFFALLTIPGQASGTRRSRV
jgi:O-antigen ligase